MLPNFLWASPNPVKNEQLLRFRIHIQCIQWPNKSVMYVLASVSTPQEKKKLLYVQKIQQYYLFFYFDEEFNFC